MTAFTVGRAPRSVVLFGAKGSGKDTVGSILKRDYGFETTSFAAPLKAMAKIAFPAFTDEDLYGSSSRRETQYPSYPKGPACLSCNGILLPNDQEEVPPGYELICCKCGQNYGKHVSPRDALTTLGTEWGRRLYANVWIDLVAENMRVTQRDTVITDGRFRNELFRSHENGTKSIVLLRNYYESTAMHASEAEMRSIPLHAFSCVLDNRGPLGELEGLLEKAMTTLYEAL